MTTINYTIQTNGLENPIAILSPTQNHVPLEYYQRQGRHICAISFFPEVR